MTTDFTDQPKRPGVLIVDDEAAVRDFVRIVLTHAGYSVHSVADAKQALEVFQAEPERFGLVLSDVRMPGRTGVELAADLQARTPNIPIVFMSGFTGGTTHQPITLPAGAVVLEKPFSLDALLHVVKKAIR